MPRKNETNEINLMKESASNGARTLVEISEKTGIDYKRIIYILSKHPIIKERLLQIFEENRRRAIYKKTKQSENKSSTFTLSEECEYIVIDASVCGSKGILAAIHREVNQNNKKVLLTDITIEELSKLEDGDDNTAYSARRILSNSNLHPNTYNYIKIDKPFDTPDKNIIAFASKLKNVILFTSDKAMSILAKLEGIEVNFFLKTDNILHGIDFKNGKPYIKAGDDSNRFIIIRRNYDIFLDGYQNLKDNDEIFMFKPSFDNAGTKILYFKVNINNNYVNTSLLDRVFVKSGQRAPYKYKYVYGLYNQKTEKSKKEA